MSRRLKNRIQEVVDKSKLYEAAIGTIFAIDGGFADVRLSNSPGLLRHVEIFGDPSGLSVGNTVLLQWVNRAGTPNKVPVVLSQAYGYSGYGSPQSSVAIDGITIVNGTYGLEVGLGSIGLHHLNFVPSLEGHTHKDSLERAGWQVTSDGVIYKDATFIHPSGQISLGYAPNVVKLDSGHATHRIWAGNQNPTLAPFSVQKDGKIKAVSGEIAGWNLADTSFWADSGKATISAGTYPYISLGDATGFMSGIGFWVGKDADTIYKLRVGNPDGDHMRWDGSQLYVTGTFVGGSDIGYTLANVYTINYDETDADAGLIIDHADGEVSLIWDGAVLALDKTLRILSDAENYVDVWATPSGVLRISPTSSIQIDSTISTADWVSGSIGWGVDATGVADFRSVFTNEIHAISFVADVQRALAGSEIITKSVSSVAQPFDPTSGEIIVYDIPVIIGAVFQDGDIVRVRNVVGGTIYEYWGTVGGYISNGDGTQWYEIDYDYGGGTSVIYPVGTPVIAFGSVANPYGSIILTAIDSQAPFIQISNWSSTPWSGTIPYVRLGYLNGVAEGGDEWGLWAKKDTNQYLVLSDAKFEVHGMSFSMYDGATLAVKLDPAVPSFAMGNPLPDDFDTGTGIWMGKDTVYKFRVGDPSGQMLSWDGTDLIVTGSLIAADGSVTIDEDALSITRIGYSLSYLDGSNNELASMFMGHHITASSDYYYLDILVGTMSSVTMTNPGFETGTLGGWTPTIGNGSIAVSSSEKHSGTYSVYMYVSDDPFGDEETLVSNNYGASVNDIAYGTFWFGPATKSGSNAYIEILIEFLNSSYSVLAVGSYYTVMTSGTGWTKVEMQTTPAPTNTAYVRFKVHGISSSISSFSCYFDDFTLAVAANNGKIRLGNEKIALYGNSTVYGTLSTTGSLSVTGNISVTGTVDNVDIASFKSSFDTHIGATNPHSVTLEQARSAGSTMSGGFTVNGSITITGTVDGVDISTLNSSFSSHIGATNPHSVTLEQARSAGSSLSGTVTSSGDFRTSAGISVGSTTNDPGNGDLWATGDIRVSGGIYAGSISSNPNNGDVWATVDGRFAGGISIGNIGADPAGSQLRIYNGSSWEGELICNGDGWFRINQNIAINIYTPRYIYAAGGFRASANAVPGTGDITYDGQLVSYKGASYEVFPFRPLTTQIDGSGWAPKSCSTTSKTLIDMSTVFSGYPSSGVKAVVLNVAVRDSGAAGTDCYAVFGANNVSGNGAWISAMAVNDRWNRGTLIVPCDANGDIYYQCVASGTSTLDIYLRLQGYFI